MTVASSLSTFRNRTRASSGVADRAASDLTERFTERRAMTDGGATTNGVSNYENYGGVGYEQNQNLEGRNFVIQTPTVRPQASPGEFKRFTFTVINNNLLIGADNPNKCEYGSGFFGTRNGIRVQGDLYLQGVKRDSNDTCVKIFENPLEPDENREELTLGVEMPVLETGVSQRTVTVRVEFFLPGSGDAIDVWEEQIQVVSGYTPPDDDPNDPNDPNNGCSVVDVILGRNGCTVEDVTNPSQFLFLGAGTMLVLLLVILLAG